MIRRLKYHEIDFNKYSSCLENSFQRKYSAARLFLDITSDKKWELLVYKDYEAVMPVPYVFKLGKKIVHNQMMLKSMKLFCIFWNRTILSEFIPLMNTTSLKPL